MWKNLLILVSDTYRHFDEDRALTERSLELSSKELSEKNKKLEEDLEELKRSKGHIEELEEAQARERTQRNQVERLNKFMIDRELKMVELKKRIAELESNLPQQATPQ